MTMKEADEAASMYRPVVFNGIEYKRITRTGYTYDLRKGRIGFVELLDKNKNCVVYADPALCEVKQLTE